MSHPAPAAFRRSLKSDLWASVAIFLISLLLFLHSPVSQMGDSKYTLLLTQNLLTKGSFVLDGYGIPHDPRITEGAANVPGNAYQTEFVGGHLYYYFPPGSSILSAPFVLIGDALGQSVLRADQTYDEGREDRLQRVIASVLMAALAVIFCHTARCLLPPGWSGGVALGGVLGTQVWSTASRALWTHTWGILLLGGAIFLLLARETGRRKLPAITLATVLSWTYFVRPTNSIFIVGITVYLALFHREVFLRYAVTGAAWFAGFVTYSWAHFGRLLPSYYQTNRLELSHFWEGLAGNLVSPSRGLLVFVPVTLFVGYLLGRNWRWLPHRRLVWLALAVSAGHGLAVSCFVPWLGGACYGPRYTTELVPWLGLLAILGLRAARARRAETPSRLGTGEWRTTLAFGGSFLLLSVLLNARGGETGMTMRWNQVPASIDDHPERVWDWRYPQFLAGLVGQPLPAVFPVLDGERITFGQSANRAFLLDGWSTPEPVACWTENRWATLIFAVDDLSEARLRLGFTTYIRRPWLRHQRIIIDLNGQRLADLTEHEREEREYTFDLPAGRLRGRNMLTFRLPDATAPASISWKDDTRPLGIALSWIELDRGRPTQGAKR